ncbi:hypothetical protein DL93DRAFT_66599 [Clavulina sp. PMI_390]|nr:hypothetical protein DL93DRAFT_66599 [Clavulina sp. PMI_390]
MFSKAIAALSLAALAPQALASLYITSPVASTDCSAETACQVAWNDDGTTPALGTIGICDVGLYVGNQYTQFLLQDLGNLNIASQATASFLPNPAVGGNSNLYFIRFTATNYFPNNDGIPWEGFSAKFTLNGMTGTFNSTVASVMSNTASSTSGATSTTGSVLATTTGGSTTSLVTTTSKAASSTSSGTAKSTATTTSKSGAASAYGSSSQVAAFASIIISAFFAAAAF